MEQSDNFGHEARTLTCEEIDKISSDIQLVSEFHQNKLEKDAKKNWDLFYKRNTNKFFKDRHWTTREFEELLDLSGLNDNVSTDHVESKGKRNLLEVGCGVGNFIWPLIKENLNYNFYACDFSSIALDVLKQNELYDETKCTVFQADASEPNGIASRLPDSSVKFHLVSLVFVLSAIHPDKMKNVFKNIFDVR